MKRPRLWTLSRVFLLYRQSSRERRSKKTASDEKANAHTDNHVSASRVVSRPENSNSNNNSNSNSSSSSTTTTTTTNESIVS